MPRQGVGMDGDQAELEASYEAFWALFGPEALRQWRERLGKIC